MHDISEENLWLLCLNGDRDAFKEMYCRFYSLLYYYGLKLVSDKELVKDCIQDIFIKIIQNHSTLSPTLNVKGYLIKTLRNKIIDTIEKEKGKMIRILILGFLWMPFQDCLLISKKLFIFIM